MQSLPSAWLTELERDPGHETDISARRSSLRRSRSRLRAIGHVGRHIAIRIFEFAGVARLLFMLQILVFLRKPDISQRQTQTHIKSRWPKQR